MHSKSADPLGGAPRVPGTNLDTVYGFGRSPLAGPAVGMLYRYTCNETYQYQPAATLGWSFDS